MKTVKDYICSLEADKLVNTYFEKRCKKIIEYYRDFADVEQCFAKAYGKTFELEEKAEIVVTDLTPPGTVNGHMLAHYRFEGKYPWIKQVGEFRVLYPCCHSTHHS